MGNVYGKNHLFVTEKCKTFFLEMSIRLFVFVPVYQGEVGAGADVNSVNITLVSLQILGYVNEVRIVIIV